MMRCARTVPWVLAVLAALAACGVAGEPKGDPLTAEIGRLSASLKGKPAGDSMWAEVRQSSEPALVRAEEDLRSGRQLLALQRIAGTRAGLTTVEYLKERPSGQHREMAAFEAEWARLGGVLRDDLGAPSSAAFGEVRPAAVRALAEAAFPQVRGFYEASLEYGRSTRPTEGLYYLGNAQAQRDLVGFFREISEPSSRREPPVRAIGPELDALEAEMLAAYRPPASIDRHREFIEASSSLKEARELDAAGLHHGALLRYLQTALRFAPLRPAPPSGGDWKALESRLSAGNVDHSLGRLFLETAQAEPALAPAITGDVLPRYFAALEPARPAPPKPAPRVTVTLVRWPYT
jgi:hypothetical protein